MAIFTQPTWLQAVGLTIFLENWRFGNMRIITSISIVSSVPMSSSSSPFTYKSVEVIFGRIYFYFHLQTDHWLQSLQVTIFPENVGFGNMRIITLISIVSWLPISSSTSPFTYKAVEVIFGSIYFYFHLQTDPNLQDCSHSHNLPTFPESTLFLDVMARDQKPNLQPPFCFLSLSHFRAGSHRANITYQFYKKYNNKHIISKW